MAGTTSSGLTPSIGAHQPYRWLNTELEMREFIKLFPQVFVGKYMAVTSIDSGILRLSEEDRARGWRSEGDIAYSPMITSIAELPTETHPEYCEGFYEFYLFDTPPGRLGDLHRGNIFESRMMPGEVHTFVNYYAFDLSGEDFSGMFWQQIQWVNPMSYIADGKEHLTFVSRDANLFESVADTLNRAHHA